MDISILLSNYHKLKQTCDGTLQNPQNWVIQHECFELTPKSGLPHIHFLLRSDKYISTERMRGRNKPWRVDHQKVKFKKQVTDYIHKEKTKPPSDYDFLNLIPDYLL